jgi:hypothetical protein
MCDRMPQGEIAVERHKEGVAKSPLSRHFRHGFAASAGLLRQREIAPQHRPGFQSSSETKPEVTRTDSLDGDEDFPLARNGRIPRKASDAREWSAW